MNLEDLKKHDPIKTTGWSSYEEYEAKDLYEVDGRFFVLEHGYCVYSQDPNPYSEIVEIPYEAALLFLDNDDPEFIE